MWRERSPLRDGLGRGPARRLSQGPPPFGRGQPSRTGVRRAQADQEACRFLACDPLDQFQSMVAYERLASDVAATLAALEVVLSLILADHACHRVEEVRGQEMTPVQVEDRWVAQDGSELGHAGPEEAEADLGRRPSVLRGELQGVARLLDTGPTLAAVDRAAQFREGHEVVEAGHVEHPNRVPDRRCVPHLEEHGPRSRREVEPVQLHQVLRPQPLLGVQHSGRVSAVGRQHRQGDRETRTGGVRPVEPPTTQPPQRRPAGHATTCRQSVRRLDYPLFDRRWLIDRPEPTRRYRAPEAALHLPARRTVDSARIEPERPLEARSFGVPRDRDRSGGVDVGRCAGARGRCPHSATVTCCCATQEGRRPIWGFGRHRRPLWTVPGSLTSPGAGAGYSARVLTLSSSRG